MFVERVFRVEENKLYSFNVGVRFVCLKNSKMISVFRVDKVWGEGWEGKKLF